MTHSKQYNTGKMARKCSPIWLSKERAFVKCVIEFKSPIKADSAN